ncbi:hypothetical protein J6590_060361 [Homalodisca vitripennis]|nr:hypothetical protein J6590_060361 [Homalodisca vitripennis]
MSGLEGRRGERKDQGQASPYSDKIRIDTFIEGKCRPTQPRVFNPSYVIDCDQVKQPQGTRPSQ